MKNKGLQRVIIIVMFLKGENLGEEEVKCSWVLDFIYAGNINCLHSNNVMKDILDDYTLFPPMKTEIKYTLPKFKWFSWSSKSNAPPHLIFL